MGKELGFDGKVVLVTGAGQGLGKSHALAFAARGAKVVVNDLGGSATGGGTSRVADTVVEEIKAAGGEAVANYDSVEDGEKLVQTALDTWGRIDVVVNNAGILRDTSFPKMTDDDWDLIYRVHVRGSYKVTKAAWPHMREQRYGRIIMTSSAAGIYGNFGQANYAMAKLGLTGFSNTLALEGARRGIQVNTIAPIAGSRLTETILPPELLEALKPEYVSPLVLWLCHENCEENGGLFEVGGGFFSKLRWERTEGLKYRVGRNITVDDIAKRWDDVVDFEKTTHPASVTESMMTIMDNINAGKSHGGNEYIDVDLALGYEYPDTTTSYDERDLALYALGVGAAHDPLDNDELQTVYELHSGGFKALPTFAAVPVINNVIDLAKKGKMAPGLNFGFDRLLHGEQYTELKRPLPAKGELTHKMRIKDIFDKGKGALIVTETETFDEDGDLLAINTFTAFIRGAGGWGGERGPSADVNAAPERAPDVTIAEAIPENQALLYRLSGDINPLHADPSFAAVVGFDRPILHGMCTYGYAARHAIKALSNNDPRYFKSIKARFADSVYPGETLITEVWKESDTRAIVRCKVKERDVVVISNAAVELYAEIPKKVAKVKAAPVAAAAPVSAEPISADVFEGISRFIAATPDITQSVGVVYAFQLTNPDSLWTVDLKAGNVAAGATTKAECTLTIADETFMAMCRGEADPQKLFFGGELKIAGNVMASQKLDFLQKIDPKTVLSIARERVGAGKDGASTQAPQAAPTITSAVVFRAIGAWLAKNPAVSERINMTFAWKLTDPGSSWVMQLKDGGAVFEGEGKADTTLTLSDANFMAMVAGEADPQKLFFSGDLKIAGNVMAAQKLDFLQKVDASEMEAALADSPVTDAAPVAVAATREAFAPGLFSKLSDAVGQDPTLAQSLGATVVIAVKDLDKSWVIDFKNGSPSVTEGASEDADTTLTLEDDDLAALVSGEETPANLFQRGRLRIDGAIANAHKLSFLNKLAN